MVEQEKPDWDAFLDPKLVIKDPPVPGAVQGMEKLSRLGHSFTFLTGRREALKETTIKWLETNLSIKFDNFWYKLIMRPNDNKELPTVFKGKMIKFLLNMYRNQEIIAFDDDLFMFPVYMHYGITAFKAPECWKAFCPITENLPPEQQMRL